MDATRPGESILMRLDTPGVEQASRSGARSEGGGRELGPAPVQSAHRSPGLLPILPVGGFLCFVPDALTRRDYIRRSGPGLFVLRVLPALYGVEPVLLVILAVGHGGAFEGGCLLL